MLKLLSIISACYLGTKAIKEQLEPVAPANRRFDWDAYHEDIARGMSAQKQLKKVQSGGYYTTKPEVIKVSNKDDIKDFKRYERDKELYGLAIAEELRKRGHYLLDYS